MLQSFMLSGKHTLISLLDIVFSLPYHFCLFFCCWKDSLFLSAESPMTIVAKIINKQEECYQLRWFWKARHYPTFEDRNRTKKINAKCLPFTKTVMIMNMWRQWQKRNARFSVCLFILHIHFFIHFVSFIHSFHFILLSVLASFKEENKNCLLSCL